ncbi:universal stress protein [Corynebacterium hindlerae]|uniref:universal stress protein n=1 Tax=Corynebacterium hindlerae TaxID=699041 RepID=UPI003AAE62A8
MAYQSIVVGTDGTASSLLAVRKAATIAQRTSAQLTLVVAFHNRNSSLRGDPNTRPEDLPYVPYELADRIVDRAVATATEQGIVAPETQKRLGDPVDVLLDVIRTQNADLLVSGNKGIRTLSGRVFGAIPTEVTRRALVDVLLVNTSTALSDVPRDSSRYGTILVGTDGTSSALLAVQRAAALAVNFNAQLVIATAYQKKASALRPDWLHKPGNKAMVFQEDVETILEQARTTAAGEGDAEVLLVSREGEPADVLLQLATDHDVDLVVSGNKGVRSFSGRVFGNIPTEIVRRSEIDVLLVDTSSSQTLESGSGS